MKILIIGAGKMGTFFCDVLNMHHEVAIFDTNPDKLRFTFNTQRMTKLEEIKEFNPDLLINAATVKYTLKAFEMVMPYISDSCIISGRFTRSGFRKRSNRRSYFNGYANPLPTYMYYIPYPCIYLQ